MRSPPSIALLAAAHAMRTHCRAEREALVEIVELWNADREARGLSRYSTREVLSRSLEAVRDMLKGTESK